MEELGIVTPVEKAVEEKPTIKSYGSLLAQLNGTANNNSTLSSVNSDIYFKLKKLEKEYELLTLQEDYIKDEQRHLNA